MAMYPQRRELTEREIAALAARIEREENATPRVIGIQLHNNMKLGDAN